MDEYILVNEGKKKKYKFWAVFQTSKNNLIICYGSFDDMDISLRRLRDMKAQESYPKTINPHQDMLKRVRKKWDEGYENAPPDVQNVVKKELNRRYGGTLFGQEEQAESPQADSASNKEKKEKKNWKPSDDFAWF